MVEANNSNGVFLQAGALVEMIGNTL